MSFGKSIGTKTIKRFHTQLNGGQEKLRVQNNKFGDVIKHYVGANVRSTYPNKSRRGASGSNGGRHNRPAEYHDNMFSSIEIKSKKLRLVRILDKLNSPYQTEIF